MVPDPTARGADEAEAEVRALRESLEALRRDPVAWLIAMDTRPAASIEFLHPAESDLVSVIVPAFNAAPFLARAARSVWRQDLAGRGIELLVIDDGSEDATVAIASRLQGESPIPMHVLTHPGGANRGPGATRNLGLRHARGASVALLDADDVFLPHRLSRGIAHLEANPHIVCLASHAENRDLEGRLVAGWGGSTTAGDFRHAAQAADFVPPYTFEQLLRGDPVVNSTILLRRGALEAVGGYSEVMAHQAEDWLLLAKLSLLAPIEVLPEVLIQYTVHPGSYTARYFAEGLGHGVRVEFLNHLVHWMLQHPAYRDKGIAVFRQHYPRLMAARAGACRLIEEFYAARKGRPGDLPAFEAHLEATYRELDTLRQYRDTMERILAPVRRLSRASRTVGGAAKAAQRALTRRRSS